MRSLSRKRQPGKGRQPSCKIKPESSLVFLRAASTTLFVGWYPPLGFGGHSEEYRHDGLDGRRTSIAPVFGSDDKLARVLNIGCAFEMHSTRPLPDAPVVPDQDERPKEHDERRSDCAQFEEEWVLICPSGQGAAKREECPKEMDRRNALQ